jgi:Serine carboxypeptidase
LPELFSNQPYPYFHFSLSPGGLERRSPSKINIAGPTAQNEVDVAAQLVGFFQQFLEVFSELKGKKFYVTGESVSLLPSSHVSDVT